MGCIHERSVYLACGQSHVHRQWDCVLQPMIVWNVGLRNYQTGKSPRARYHDTNTAPRMYAVSRDAGPQTTCTSAIVPDQTQREKKNHSMPLANNVLYRVKIPTRCQSPVFACFTGGEHAVFTFANLSPTLLSLGQQLWRRSSHSSRWLFMQRGSTGREGSLPRGSTASQHHIQVQYYRSAFCRRFNAAKNHWRWHQPR